MANATANVSLNVTGNAQQQLQKTQKSVENLQKSFGALKNIVGGLAIGSFITNVLRSADAMDDLAKATGISIATIDGFSAALKMSGGEAEDAGTMIAKLSQSIEEGRQGTLKAEYQFNKLGISVQELRNLSDEDVLRKTLDSLAKMPAGAERTALAMELLGKKAKTIDWNNLNGSLDMFIQKAQKAEPGTKALAQLYDNLQGIAKSFTQQLTIGGANFAETLAKLTENTDAIAKSLVELTRIVTILGSAFTIFNKVIPGIKQVRNGIASITAFTGFSRLAKDIDLIVINFKKFLGILPSTYTALQSLGFSLANVGVLLTRLSGYGLIIYGIGEAFKALTGTINPVVSLLKILRDVGVVALAGYVEILKTIGIAFKKAFDFTGITAAFKAVANVIIPIFAPAFNWLENKLKGIAKFWRDTVDAAEQTLGLIAREDFTKPLVIRGEGAEAMPKDYFTAGRQQRQKAADEQKTQLQKLQLGIEATTQAFLRQREAQLSALQAQASYVNMSQETRDVLEAQKNIYDDFNAKIEEYENKIIDLKDEEKGLQETYLGQIEILKQVRDEQMVLAAQAIKTTQEQINAQQDLQAELQRTLAQWKATSALEDLEAELNLLGLQGDELERQQKIMRIQQQMRDTVQDVLGNIIDLELRRGRISDEQYQREKSNLEQQLELARETAAAKLQIDEEYFKRKSELENSYSEGAKRALQDIAEQYKPINVAQDAIKKSWDNIGDAIDNFVTTGKFKFKDFAASVIADLTKIIAKALILQAIKSIFGNFGIPGLAEGGPAKAGKPYIVGEKGPELFVPKTSGTVVPNDAMKNGVATGAVNAPVTNNYNTYNINAVDAKSVAQLFAENRRVLLGTVKMAERELPYMA